MVDRARGGQGPRRTKLSEQLTAILAREIVAGRMPAAEAIPPEAEFAVRFGLSNPVVRESLRSLEAVGMLRVQHGKRTLVLESTEWNLLSPVVQDAYLAEGLGARLAGDLYEVRLILEPPTAARAASRGSAALGAELLELSGDMNRVAHASRAVPEFLALDRRFHQTIARASGNDVLRTVLRYLHSFLANWVRSSTSAGHLPTLARQHAEIANAVARRDPVAAAGAMTGHLEFAMQLETAGSMRPTEDSSR